MCPLVCILLGYYCVSVALYFSVVQIPLPSSSDVTMATKPATAVAVVPVPTASKVMFKDDPICAYELYHNFKISVNCNGQ